ncbi:MAG: CDP-alcohol phosphatidyltransferase family protein [Gemmatimonadaceae bacterium]
MAESPRRYLRTREQRWPRALASTLANVGFRPNGISVLSIVVGIGAGFALWRFGAGGNWHLLVAAAAVIQLRLLCNMLDGLLAVEGGFKSKLGDLYNEIPDRIADVAILVGAGYAVVTMRYGVVLGWSAAILAVLTAYLRVLAGSLGAQQLFIGPMAKQHRMFVITLGCLLGAIEHARFGSARAVWVALVIVVAGSIVTLGRRLARLAAELESR